MSIRIPLDSNPGEIFKKKCRYIFRHYTCVTGPTRLITFMNIKVTKACQRLKHDLRAMGIEQGDRVMVHASLSAIGIRTDHTRDAKPPDRGKSFAKQAVIPSLLKSVGSEGTVIMPALSGTDRWFAMEKPKWDTAFAISNGSLYEWFRQYPGVVRSIHPTHSVIAKGKDAGTITQGHLSCQTPCGIGSPYDKLKQMGGKILLIGTNLNRCTFIHHLEEVFNLPGHMSNRRLSIEIDGSISEISVHATKARLSRAKLLQGIPDIGPKLSLLFNNPDDNFLEPKRDCLQQIETVITIDTHRACLRRLLAQAYERSGGFFSRDFTKLTKAFTDSGNMISDKIGNADCFLLQNLQAISSIFEVLALQDPCFLKAEK